MLVDQHVQATFTLPHLAPLLRLRLFPALFSHLLQPPVHTTDRCQMQQV